MMASSTPLSTLIRGEFASLVDSGMPTNFILGKLKHDTDNMPIEMREREYLMLDVSSSLTSVEDGAGYNCLRPDLTTYFNFGVKQKILVLRNYTFDFSSLKTV